MVSTFEHFIGTRRSNISTTAVCFDSFSAFVSAKRFRFVSFRFGFGFVFILFHLLLFVQGTSG